MSNVPLITRFSKEAIEKAYSLADSGKSPSAIEQVTGINARTVRDFLKARRQGREIVSRSHEAPQIVSAAAAVSPMPIDELWDRAAEINDRKIQEAVNLHNFEAAFHDNLPIAVSFASDQHISVGNTVDLKQMKADAELIASTDGMSVVCVGDAIDGHIKHRAAMLHARSTPGDQYKLLDYYLGIIQEKLLVLVSGNHDDWTNQFAGVDVLKMLADKNRVMHAPDEARIRVQLPGHAYEIAARHQYRFNSQLNQTHSLKQWFKMGSAAFDIGVLAHLHELAMEPVTLHGLERWVCRPGSYQITSAYSRQLGFNPVNPSCPTFILYPDRRDIVGFTGLRHAARFLTYERQRYAEAARVIAAVPRSLRQASKARRVPAKGTAAKRNRRAG